MPLPHDAKRCSRFPVPVPDHIHTPHGRWGADEGEKSANVYAIQACAIGDAVTVQAPLGVF